MKGNKKKIEEFMPNYLEHNSLYKIIHRDIFII